MDCFVACAPRNDGRTYSNFKQPAAYGHGFAISPHVFARVLLVTSRSLPSEGAGNAGRAMRPRPRMQNETSIRVSHHGHTGTTRHSPRKGEYWHKNLQYINAMRLMCPPWCHFEIDAQEKPYKVGAARRWPASAASARPNQPPPGRRRWLAAGAMGSSGAFHG